MGGKEGRKEHSQIVRHKKLPTTAVCLHAPFSAASISVLTSGSACACVCIYFIYLFTERDKGEGYSSSRCEHRRKEKLEKEKGLNWKTQRNMGTPYISGESIPRARDGCRSFFPGTPLTENVIGRGR